MERITILIADDSAAARDGLRAILDVHTDLDVLASASNGAEAVKLAGALAPAVVLMDAQMPVMDGAEATRRIKAENPATRVIVLTVHPSQLQSGLDAGADEALLKDIARADLLRAIRAS